VDEIKLVPWAHTPTPLSEMQK